MRSILHSFALTDLVLRAIENGNGAAIENMPLPSDSPAIGSRILPDLSDKPVETPMQAHIAADGAKRAASKRKQAATTKPASKPATPPSKPAKAAKPNEQPAQHDIAGSYNGPSPSFRHHGRKLSPIVLDRIPGSFTERDRLFLSDLYKRFGEKPFLRLDADAGNVSRAIGHAYLKHAGGSLDERTCKLQLTAKYIAREKAAAKLKQPSA